MNGNMNKLPIQSSENAVLTDSIVISRFTTNKTNYIIKSKFLNEVELSELIYRAIVKST